MFYPIPTVDPSVYLAVLNVTLRRPETCSCADPLKQVLPFNPEFVQPALLPIPETLFPNGILIGDPAALQRPPTLPCGPAFRLTPSLARRTGSVW